MTTGIGVRLPGDDAGQSLPAVAARKTHVLLVLALVATVGGMFQLGVAGRVIGYISAKLASEALVVCLPTLLAKIRDEERAEAVAAGSVEP